MRAYGQDYWSVLKLPLKTFWSLNRQVNRLRAEEDFRLLRVFNAGSSESQDAARKLSEELINEMGRPAIVEKKFDEDKFLELQKKFAASAA